jgi:hypothetical protein
VDSISQDLAIGIIKLMELLLLNGIHLHLFVLSMSLDAHSDLLCFNQYLIQYHHLITYLNLNFFNLFFLFPNFFTMQIFSCFEQLLQIRYKVAIPSKINFILFIIFRKFINNLIIDDSIFQLKILSFR